MKKSLFVLGAAAALAAPFLSLRADDTVQSKKRLRSDAGVARSNHAMKTAAVQRSREVIYITDHVVTGSHIPVVVTRYQGRNITSSPLVSYDQSDLSATGALDVGGTLVTRDPAISFGRGR